MNQLNKTNKGSGDQWIDKVKYRRQNKKWLGYSRRIALRILSAIEDTPGMNQKMLSELADVSQQHVSKIIKGQENLTLYTIAKFSEILKVELIEFPQFNYNYAFNFFLDADSNISVMMYISVNEFRNITHEPMEFIYSQPIGSALTFSL